MKKNTTAANCLTGLLMLAASEFMCLVLGVSFSIVSWSFAAPLCAICDFILYAGLMWNAGYTMAMRDFQSKPNRTLFTPVGYAVITSIPLWLLWGVLLLAWLGIPDGFQFYDIYKILNAQLLQLCNLLVPDSEQSSIEAMDLFLFLLCSLIPTLGISLGYHQTIQGQTIQKAERVDDSSR